MTMNNNQITNNQIINMNKTIKIPTKKTNIIKVILEKTISLKIKTKKKIDQDQIVTISQLSTHFNKIKNNK